MGEYSGKTLVENTIVRSRFDGLCLKKIDSYLCSLFKFIIKISDSIKTIASTGTYAYILSQVSFLTDNTSPDTGRDEIFMNFCPF